jgi:hypothetical protein
VCYRCFNPNGRDGRAAVIQEYEEKEETNAAIRNLERLEIAHVRFEAALETSNKWWITDTSMLRWQKLLKHAAQHCDKTLHKCKHNFIINKASQKKVFCPQHLILYLQFDASDVAYFFFVTTSFKPKLRPTSSNEDRVNIV